MRLGIACILLLGLHVSAWPADVPQTYIGQVVKVADGDTLSVSIDGWPEPFNPVEVRVFGIDTPESQKQFAKCAKELKLGLIAKRRAKQLLPIGSMVGVQWVGDREKYGRLLARIRLPDGQDFATIQINDGMAKRYGDDGNLTKESWCKP